jgi:hypothetical protein
MQVFTVSVCEPFGVHITQLLASVVSVPLVLSAAERPHSVNEGVPVVGKLSPVAQMGGVGHVGHAGLTVKVSGTGQ